MSRDDWLIELQMLVTHFGESIGADVASLSLIELWWLYLRLSRLVEG
ncbi:MAG: hypothetical protein V4440_07225 [Pseudomonadota bacterium]